MKLLGLSLVSSPAVAAWMAADRRQGSPRHRWIAWGAVAVTVLVAVLLLVSPIRWQVTALIWGLYCLLGGAVVAFLAPPATREAESARDDWARRTLQLAVPLLLFIPLALVVLRLLVWAPLGPLLARLNPQVASSEDFVTLTFFDSLWAIPCGLVFVALSLRQGRLRSLGDFFAAFGAWGVFLLLREVLLFGTLGLLATQNLALLGHGDLLAGQLTLMILGFAVLSVPWTLRWAWKPRPVWRKALEGLAGVAATVICLGLWVGLTAQGHLMNARWQERRGNLEGAMEASRRALLVGSSPYVEAYLQHRIGLLHLKLGHVDRALAAFRLVATTRNRDDELVRLSLHYLDRLEDPQPGERVVLDGVEVRTEHRAAYCAPNTLALVFGYWEGEPQSVSGVGQRIAYESLGSLMSDIRFEAERRGYEHRLVPFAGLDDLRWLIDRGVPALLYQPGHVMAVFGYDDRLGTAVTYDTAQWDIWMDQPYEELLEAWGETYFLMGLVLPRGDGERFDEVRGRYPASDSEAAWFWYLAQELRATRKPAGYWERALLQSPSFFPAVFELLDEAHSATDRRRWIEEHGDPGAMIARAHRMLDRPQAPRDEIAQGLASWHAAGEDWAAIRELAERGLEGSIPLAAGLAAYEDGDWQGAASLLDESRLGSPISNTERLRALSEVRRRLGDRTGTAEALADLLEYSRGDQLEPMLAETVELADTQPASFRVRLFERALTGRPREPAYHLGYSGALLDQLEREPPDSDEQRDLLQLARRAARLARLLSDDEADAARADALLARAEQVEAGLGESRGDTGRVEDPSPEVRPAG